MKIVTWNVNGYRACLTKGFREFFDSVNSDIFCVQETKMQTGQADVEIEGYHCFMSSAEKKGYSGTLIYTKKEPLSINYGIDGEYSDEGRLITLEYENFFIVNCYTPNSQEGLKRLDYRMNFEVALRTYLAQLNKKKPVILCGDLNVAHQPIDLKNPKQNEQNAGYSIEERTKFSELLEIGFVDSFRYLHPEKVEYSWWSYRFNARQKNIGWRIDYFLVSKDIAKNIRACSICTDVYGSDHCPVILDCEL